MISIIIRAIVIYAILLVLLRLMGKRQIAQMQPFELVLTIIIADLATVPMGDLSVPLLHGIVPLFTLSVVHFILTMATKKSSTFNRFVSGKPIIVINPDGIDEQALTDLKISIDDVFAAIREKGFFKLEQVEYAIMETNGVVNVLPKQAFAPATNQDLGIKSQPEFLPVTLVSEGSALKNNFKVAGLGMEYVKKVLKHAKIASVKDCLVLTVDKNHDVYVQARGKKFEHFKEFEP